MLILAVIFVVTAAMVLACVGLATAFFKSKQKNQIRSMLQKAEATPAEQRSSQLIRPADVEDFLAKLLRRFEFMGRLNLILEQAGLNWKASKLIGISCVTSALGFLLGSKLRVLYNAQASEAAFAVLGAVLPLVFVLRKRAKAIAAFEEQFPEGLDFLSRSMRVGHGFTIGLEMLALDSPDPLGAAFRRVSNDLQLGSPLDVALGRLMTLVPLVDVRFFVSSVILQQETGGNLGEILNKLAYVIRERFRLKGQVKAASAHGRITGLVLLLMPIAVTAFIMVTTPEYLTTMFATKIGRIMVYGAIAGQIVGYFVIKKIVNIKV
ncbi:MAG: type II secretion system F family protein [Acidobacteriaceae bacterium]|nr:type II secretion system F family protein [Acidobacteriaceae bacterium]MBV9778483.1 type II secretion system F family protein [Acidobacteriaceae bacterium]